MPTTGNWYTWEEIKESRDDEELPRIYLTKNTGFRSSYTLHIDCQYVGPIKQKRILELYISWTEPTPQLPVFGTPERPIAEYTIQGGKDLRRHWTPGKYNPNVGSLFAPESVRDDILSALDKGAKSLAVKVKGKTYNFAANGFKEAAKPVLNACRR